MNVGPYTKVVRDSKWTPDGSPVEIRGIIYGAYNAHGLIGSEYNGIALFDETNLQVITDNVGRSASSSIYIDGTPGKDVVKLLDQIEDMSWEELLDYVKNTPNYRSCFEVKEDTRSLQQILGDGNIGGNRDNKEAFMEAGTKFLTKVARDLGETRGCVRTCVGGPAVSGEVILHTDSLYVSLSEGYSYARTCKGKKDYTGGSNVGVGEYLGSPGQMTRFLKRLSPKKKKGSVRV